MLITAVREIGARRGSTDMVTTTTTTPRNARRSVKGQQIVVDSPIRVKQIRVKKYVKKYNADLVSKTAQLIIEWNRPALKELEHY